MTFFLLKFPIIELALFSNGVLCLVLADIIGVSLFVSFKRILFCLALQNRSNIILTLNNMQAPILTCIHWTTTTLIAVKARWSTIGWSQMRTNSDFASLILLVARKDIMKSVGTIYNTTILWMHHILSFQIRIGLNFALRHWSYCPYSSQFLKDWNYYYGDVNNFIGEFRHWVLPFAHV